MYGVALVVSSSLLVPATPPARRPVDRVPDLMQRGDKYWHGEIDPDGNFVPDPYGGPMDNPPVSGAGWRLLSSRGDNVPAYEYRSGRLIRGTMTASGAFVPEVGSVVLDVQKDFDLERPDRVVWNRPEITKAFWTEARKREFPDGLPAGPVPPPATGTPRTRKYAPYGDRPPVVVRVIREMMEFGTLTPDGEFRPDPDRPLLPRPDLPFPPRGEASAFRRAYRMCYTLPQLAADQEDVYEFRSGRLIRGTLHKSGNFAPEAGSKLLDFGEYDPDADRRRIYNLPGILTKQ